LHFVSRIFYKWDGNIIHVICEVVPNPDVSGIGVRGAFYIEAAILIILSGVGVRPEDFFVSNLATQITCVAFIGTAYLTLDIDVPHVLIACQFAVLFSTCRITSYDFPGSFL
jgi:hypothetical protein